MAEPVTSQLPSAPLVPSHPPTNETAEEPTQASVTEQAPEPVISSMSDTSKVSITLLLVSGRRRTQEFDRKTTIGELKEMVWSNWPSDWADEQPPSSAFLRILYLGRILTDETTLSSLNLATPPEPTVVHVSVRSFAPPSDDDDGLKKKQKKRGTRRGRGNNREGSGADPASGAEVGDQGAVTNAQADNEESTGCCGCIIC